MRLVIFDLDDTLIDNTMLDIDSFRHVLSTMHLPLVSGKTIVRWRKNGMLARNIFKRVIKSKNRQVLEKCVNMRLEYLARGGGGLSLVKAKDGARETLHEMKLRNNPVIVVSSRKDKGIIKKILKTLQLNRYVDGIYCAEDCTEYLEGKIGVTDLKIKLYKLALSRYKPYKSKKPIAVGNLKSDVTAARKAGIIPIAINGSYRVDSGISKIARTIRDLREISEIL